MKNNNKRINMQTLLLVAIIFASIFMSIGYAIVNSVTVNMSGSANALAYKGVLISDATINSSSPANVSDSYIGTLFGTTMQSRVVLNSSNSSSLSMNVTIYNNSDSDKYYDNTIYGNNFYDNNNIDYTISGITHGQKLEVHNSVTFTITFKYTDEYKASNPSTYANVLNSYLNFNFINGYTITYNGFASTTGLDTTILDGETKTITFTSTTGIPSNINVIGATSSYSSPTLTLSNASTNVIVNRLFTITYSGFTGSTNSLPNETMYDGVTITFNNTTGIPTGVTVTGASSTFVSPTLTLSNVTNNVTITGVFGSQGSGTVDDPYVDYTPVAYDPDDVDPGTTVVFPNVPGDPKVTKNNSGEVVSFEYTDASASTPVVFESGDALSTGLIAMDGASFTIHIKFKADLANNNGKFFLSALQYNTSGDTFDGFSLYDYSSGYLRVGTYKARKRSNSTGLLNANNYSTYNTSAITGEHIFDVTIVYDPVGNKSQYGQIAFTTSVDGGASTTKYMRNTKAPGSSSNVVPETLTNAIVTIGGSGEGTNDDVNHVEIIEFSVTKS